MKFCLTPNPLSRWERGLVAACLLVPLFATGAQAQTVKPDSLAWYQSIMINGLVSTSATYNFNRPPDDMNQLRVFDVDDASMELTLVQLAVRHDALIGEGGFRVDIDAGTHIPFLTRSAGLEVAGVGLRQGYVTYIANLGRGLKFDFGKFVTPAGYELIDGFEAFNDNVSRSYLFGYAIPFTHTGLRIAYPLTDNFSASAMLVNGWDNSIDNNKSKTLGLQLSFSPFAGSTLFLTALQGAEKLEDQRTVLDLAASLRIADELTIGLSGDYGSEENDLVRAVPADTINGVPAINEFGDATWKGVAIYGRVKFSDAFALIVRAEVFNDPQGVRTGTAQSLREYTLTPEWKPAAHLVIRGDLRLDNSTEPVFYKNGAFVTTQPTASLNAIFTF